MGISEHLASIRKKGVKTVTIDGEDFRIGRISGADSVAFQAMQSPAEGTAKPNQMEVMAFLVARGLVSESGEQEPDLDAATTAAVNLPFSTLLGLFQAIGEHSGMRMEQAPGKA